MSEKLKGMYEDNIFVRILVNSIDTKTRDLKGEQELVALYAAMGWISIDEASEVMMYATLKLSVTDEQNEDGSEALNLK